MASQTRWSEIGRAGAESYERDLVPAMFAPWASALITLAAVGPGDRVLDVACGTGVVTRLAAATVGRAGRVVGLDSAAAMLAVAAAAAASRPPAAGAEGAEIEWLEANALAIPLPDAAVDVVLCQHGLQQFPDPPTALREMGRVLAPGGRLAVGVWSRIDANPGMAALAAALERRVSPEAAANRRRPFALGDADLLGDLLRAAGFREVHVHTLTETAHFPSPEDLVAAQLAATPLATLGTITAATRADIARDVRAALAPYLDGDALAAPMEIHVGLGRV